MNSNNNQTNRIVQEPLPPISYQRKKRKRQRLFTKDIENLLFAMGDKPVSTESTINTLEDILVDYLCQLSYQMVSFAKAQNRSRIKLNDLAYVLRNDPLKLARFQYILEQSYKIEKAKKLFDDNTKDAKEGDFEDHNDDDDNEDDDEDDEGDVDEVGDGHEHSKEDGKVGTTTKGKETKSKKKKRKVTGNVMLKD